MKRIDSLIDLLTEELADLLDAENQLAKALPTILEATQSPALKVALAHHLNDTKEQANRLQDIFSNIGRNPQGVTCEAIKEFIKEGEYAIKEIEKGHLLDSAIINMAQRVEQYEIFGYKTASELALDLGHTRAMELLNETLSEERTMNFYLNELAQGMINAQAIHPGNDDRSGGFYISKEKYSRGSIKKKSKRTDIFRS